MSLKVLVGRGSLLVGITILVATQPAVAGAQANVQQLRNQILSLEARIRDLDKRVKDLEDQAAISDQQEKEREKPADKKDSGPLTVRAPFTVVDETGRALLMVTAPGSEGEIVIVRSGDRRTVLTGSTIQVQRGKGLAALGIGSSSGAGYLALFDQSGKPAADLGVSRSTNRLSLQMWANDQVMVDLGSSDEDFDSGALRLGNGRGQFTAVLGNTNDNRMRLALKTHDGTTIAALGSSAEAQMGGLLLLANAQGKTLLTARAKATNGALSIHDISRNPVANIGADAEGRGFVSVGNAKNLEAGSLKQSETTGNGLLEVRSAGGVHVQVGVKQGMSTFGDVCVTSSKQKGICLSMLAAKMILPYF